MNTYKTIFITILTIGFIAFSCSRSAEELPDTETTQERPTADDIRSQQPSLTQDDSELGEETEPQFQPDLSHVTSREPMVLTGAFSLLGTYTGTLPCASCAGIEHELSLYENSTTGEQRYTLQRTWLSTREGDQTYYDAGPWREQERNGMRIFDLSFTDRENRIQFQVQSQRVIRLLDEQGRPIESELNYALYRLPN